MCIHILEHYDYGYAIMQQLCYGKGPGPSCLGLWLCLDIFGLYNC